MKLSNLLLVVIFLFSLIAVLLLSLSNQPYEKTPDRSEMSEGPKWEDANTKTAQSTSNYTRFIYALVIPSTGPPDSCCSDVAELDKLAQAQLKEDNRRHHGNRMWYWKSTPVDKNEYVLLIWQNLRKDEYDWIAVKNTPAFWYTIRKDGRTNIVLDGHQLVCGWYVNERYLEVRVKNPSNLKSWTPYDFWYSFTESEIRLDRKQIKFIYWLSDRVDKTCHSESE